MTQSVETQQPVAPKVRRERVLLLVAALLALLAISSSLWLPAWDVVKGGFGDSYTLYRAAVEKRHLQEFNRRLTSELIALRAKNSRKAPIEQELEAKVSALEQVVESATSLGFLKRGRDSDGEVFARNHDGSQNKTGPLASITQDPRLSKKSARREAAQGIGGAEVPCEDSACLYGATKKEIALFSSSQRDQSSDRVMNSIMEYRERLQQRMDRLAHVLRILPIGSPADGEVSSEFGRRRSPFSHSASFHEGIDLSLNRGGHVVATGDGTVLRIAYNKTYGLVVDVEHAPGLVTRYAHLTKAVVKAGQRVSRGELLALSGSTGRSTGPHLHYEIIYNSRPKNPRRFIELADELATLGFSAL